MRIPRYFPRWAWAVFGVVPLMMVIVPVAQLAFVGLEGPHANDPLRVHILGMLGFYGGYAIMAASFVSLLHTRWVRKRPNAGQGLQLLWGMSLGVTALLPQALVFGQEYWMINAVAGAVAGAVYSGLPLLSRRLR